MFPPCTGGCIDNAYRGQGDKSVSSLYGRVYRFLCLSSVCTLSFLPVREGVSGYQRAESIIKEFPPCTGGCIEGYVASAIDLTVSSLYGRVYRHNGG